MACLLVEKYKLSPVDKLAERGRLGVTHYPSKKLTISREILLPVRLFAVGQDVVFVGLSLGE